MNMINFTPSCYGHVSHSGYNPQLAAQEDLIPEGNNRNQGPGIPKTPRHLTEVVYRKGVTRIGKYAVTIVQYELY